MHMPLTLFICQRPFLGSRAVQVDSTFRDCMNLEGKTMTVEL